MKTYRTETFVFHTTAPAPCPYLPHRLERKVVTELGQGDAARFHEILSRSGFRRSHAIAYAPACPGCSACVPVRIDAANFREGRTFRRIRRANADLTPAPCPAVATGEQHRLFLRYQEVRHAGGDMAAMEFHEYRSMIEDSPIETLVLEFRDPQEELAAAVLADVMEDGLSAVYSFYRPDMPKRSLGSFVVLTLIDACRRLGLPYLYLGYWIAESRKMAYKAHFQPLEGYGPAGWHRLPPPPTDRPD
ncbi:arginyltransferase [Oleispirillum naphthae]|uniref:arginyltransferase n=1 Tax=Oleispirillum naphthae TaxID=2838853 RepID=UPI0030824F24